MERQPETPLISKRVAPKGILSLYEKDSNITDSWRDDAFCKDKDISLFFPGASEIRSLRSAAVALRICYHCPVSHHCLYESMKYNYDGVWGNTIYKQRIYLIRTELDNDLNNLTLEKAKEFVQTTKIIDVPLASPSIRKLASRKNNDELH